MDKHSGIVTGIVTGTVTIIVYQFWMKINKQIFLFFLRFF